MDLHFGIKIIELILEINYSIKNIAFCAVNTTNIEMKLFLKLSPTGG